MNFCPVAEPLRQITPRYPRPITIEHRLDEQPIVRYGHWPVPKQGEWLRQVVTGHFAYFAVPTNTRALSAFRYYVIDIWRRTLRRRSQKDGCTWDRIAQVSGHWLPKPRILHPWPDVRFAVTHPR